MLKIRLHSPWRKEILVKQYLFSSNFSLKEADALLCEWEPHNDLLEFSGPKIWYNSEAVARNMFNHDKWKSLKNNKGGQCFIFHAHTNPNFRVPMIGYVEPIKNYDHNERKDLCVAVSSNPGVDWISSEIKLRNKFITHSLVHLFGRKHKWEKYMQLNHSLIGLPENYQGEILWPWEGGDRFKIMSNYKAAICLENIVEPFYFTEKFYNAIQANCIPIYHAHETIKTNILDGALWVDPADFDFDIEKTLVFTLSENREKYTKANWEWLKTPAAQAAELSQVFLKLGQLLFSQIDR